MKKVLEQTAAAAARVSEKAGEDTAWYVAFFALGYIAYAVLHVTKIWCWMA